MQNQNNSNNENKGFRKLSEAEIEASSVFSKPQIEHRKPPKNNNVVVKTLIAVGIVFLLIAVVLLVNKFFGKSDLSSDSLTSSAEIQSEKSLSALGISANDLSSIKLTNANGTIQFYSKAEGNDKDSDGKEDNDWYINGVEKKYIDFDRTFLTANDCATVEYLFQRNFEEGVDYGFSKPVATIEVVSKKGNYTITVGKEFSNSGMQGAYLKLSNKPNFVYVLGAEHVECYTTELTYYINSYAPTKVMETKNNSEYFSNELDSFDYIELSGNLVKMGNVRFEMYGRENSNILYKMTKPNYTHIDATKLVDLLGILKDDLECYEVYYFNNKGIPSNVLSSYGLDNPQGIIQYKVGDVLTTIKLSQSETDKNYYSMVIEGVPAIYKVTRLSFEFFAYSRSNYATELVLSDNLEALKSLSLSIENKVYNFDISSVTKEEDGEEIEDIQIKYDGKTIKKENFSTFYSYLLAIEPYISDTSLVVERPENAEEYFNVKLRTVESVGDPELNLTVFKLKDNDSRYYIELDGNPIGLCKKDYADMIANNLEKLINNKDIESIL